MKYVLIALLAVSALACGEPAAPVAFGSPTVEHVENVAEKESEAVIVEKVYSSRVPQLFHGAATVEERIVGSDAVVRATMDASSYEIIQDTDGHYRITLRFTFTVQEYLLGSGANSIVVYWVDGKLYDTRAEAMADTPRITAWRDTQWDDREGILFLHDDHSHYDYLGASLNVKLAKADTYLISIGRQHERNDGYSLYSETRRAWLPLASAPSDGSEGVSGQASADSQEYLLDVPAPSGSSEGVSGASGTPTITLGDLKRRIAVITTEISASTDSDAYRECLQNKREIERINAYNG